MRPHRPPGGSTNSRTPGRSTWIRPSSRATTASRATPPWRPTSPGCASSARSLLRPRCSTSAPAPAGSRWRRRGSARRSSRSTCRSRWSTISRPRRRAKAWATSPSYGPGCSDGSTTDLPSTASSAATSCTRSRTSGRASPWTGPPRCSAPAGFCCCTTWCTTSSRRPPSPSWDVGLPVGPPTLSTGTPGRTSPPTSAPSTAPTRGCWSRCSNGPGFEILDREVRARVYAT
jgi:hypothetical protein